MNDRRNSVAPKERVNITYRPATGDGNEEVELPLKMLVIGDFQGQPDDRQLEERKPIAIDKDNFRAVMAEQQLRLTMQVPDRLGDDPDAEMAVSLEFRTLDDMAPDGIAAQVPALRTLLELRKALTALKGPLGNVPAFRKRMQALLDEPSSRQRLVRELAPNAGEEVDHA